MSPALPQSLTGDRQRSPRRPSGGSHRAEAAAARAAQGAHIAQVARVAPGAHSVQRSHTRPGGPDKRDSRARRHVAEVQRARILAAMIEVTARHGYGGASVERIVRNARVSRATFYALFDSREDCFVAALDAALARVCRVMLDAYERESTWRAGLREGLAAVLAYLDSEPELARLIVIDALAVSQRALELRQHALEALAAVVDRGREESRRTLDLPAVAAEGAVGSVFAIVHTHLLERREGTLLEMLGPLMSLLVLPYLGPVAARHERERPVDLPPAPARAVIAHEQAGARERLAMRMTDHTVNCLLHIGAHPDSSNREIAAAVGIADQGQISKLLARLANLGLISNHGDGATGGASNAWRLTDDGAHLEGVVRGQMQPA